MASKEVKDVTKTNVTKTNVTVLPLTFVIKKVYNAEQKREVYFFDVGLYPNARRFYVDKNVIEFLLNKKIIQRLNSSLFYSNSLQFVSVFVNEKETTVVKLGDKMLNGFMLRVPINDKNTQDEIEDLLENSEENVVVDWDKLQSTDNNIYYTVIISGKPNDVFNLGSYASLRLSPFGTRENEEKENTSGGARKERYNKAGIRILG